MDWSAAYREHHDAVSRQLQKEIPPLLRSRFDGADFLQEAMVSLLSRDKDHDRDHARNLLFRVARYRMIDEMRYTYGFVDRKKDPPREIGRLDENDEAIDRNPTAAENVEASELLDLLNDRLMGERDHELLRLKIEGYSTPEAAKRLGISERMAQRILKRLEQELT